MTAILLGLLLCWDANVEPDLSHYRVRFAERRVIAWEPCLCPPSPAACPPAFCPVYSQWAWAWHVVYEPRFPAPPCADELWSFCAFQHPTAVDLSGNESAQPMITNETIDWSGVCDE